MSEANGRNKIDFDVYMDPKDLLNKEELSEFLDILGTEELTIALENLKAIIKINKEVNTENKVLNNLIVRLTLGGLHER